MIALEGFLIVSGMLVTGIIWVYVITYLARKQHWTKKQ